MTRQRQVATAAVFLLAVLAMGSPPRAIASTIRVGVTGNPLQVALRLSPTSIKAGSSTTAAETVTNLGSMGLSSVRYGLLVDSTGLKVSAPSGGSTSIGPRGQSTTRFTVCALRAGSYLIQAQVTVTAPGGRQFVAVSSAQLIDVKPSSTKQACK